MMKQDVIEGDSLKKTVVAKLNPLKTKNDEFNSTLIGNENWGKTGGVPFKASFKKIFKQKDYFGIK